MNDSNYLMPVDQNLNGPMQMRSNSATTPMTLDDITKMFSYIFQANNANNNGKAAPPTGLDYANLGLTGIQTLGNLWGSYQANKLAKEQFNFLKDVTNTNLQNQISTFNTALADRARTRAQANSSSFTQSDADKYLAENKLYR